MSGGGGMYVWVCKSVYMVVDRAGMKTEQGRVRSYIYPRHTEEPPRETMLRAEPGVNDIDLRTFPSPGPPLAKIQN